MPILLIVGIYVITHGHLTPGGGFQGGSMIASILKTGTTSQKLLELIEKEYQRVFT